MPRGQEFRAKGPQPLLSRLPPARVESPERQSLFGNYMRASARPVLNREQLKQDNFSAPPLRLRTPKPKYSYLL